MDLLDFSDPFHFYAWTDDEEEGEDVSDLDFPLSESDEPTEEAEWVIDEVWSLYFIVGGV